jgi:hypothetical protein
MDHVWAMVADEHDLSEAGTHITIKPHEENRTKFNRRNFTKSQRVSIPVEQGRAQTPPISMSSRLEAPLAVAAQINQLMVTVMSNQNFEKN